MLFGPAVQVQDAVMALAERFCFFLPEDAEHVSVTLATAFLIGQGYRPISAAEAALYFMRANDR